VKAGVNGLVADAVAGFGQAVQTLAALQALEERKRLALVAADARALEEITLAEQALFPQLENELGVAPRTCARLAGVLGAADQSMAAVLWALRGEGAAQAAADLQRAYTAWQQSLQCVQRISQSNGMLLEQALRVVGFLVRSCQAALGIHSVYGPRGRALAGAQRVMDQRI